MSISVLTLTPGQYLSPTQNQGNSDPNTEIKSISITTLKTSQFCMPPDTKTKLISIQTLNQVIFDPHTKPGQLWSQHWNQVNSDLPHWNHVYFDHPCIYQVNFECQQSFSGRGTLRVMNTSTWSCDTAAAIRTRYNIITITNSYFWRFHTTVKPRKKCVNIYYQEYAR